MALKDEIQKWLREHPDATVEEAIWAGAYIEIGFMVQKNKMTMTTTGIILLVAYVAFVVGSIGYTIGFLHGNSAKHSEYNEL